MAIISNFPHNFNDEHHAWHQPGAHSAHPTRKIPQGQPGSGEEFLSWHRYYIGKVHLWYDLSRNGNVAEVYPWLEVPGGLKTAALGWDRTLARAENRIANQPGSFGSTDAIGRFIETDSGIHGWLHVAASQHYNEPILGSFHSPQSTYFYNLHGLVDRWWWLWENQSRWGSGDHFYTTSAEERDFAIVEYGFTNEGTACHVYGSQALGTAPLYRTFASNTFSGDHFYTMSAAERDYAVTDHGHLDEGIACYVYGSQVANTVPLYRLFNSHNDDHFYTTSAPERDNAITEYQFLYEGIACYVYEAPQPNTTPFYRLFLG
jgi:hypothetical protein